MRKSKQTRKKNQKGTNLKVSPLKTYKKQVKRMKNRLKGMENVSIDDPHSRVYQTRLDGAEAYLKNYDALQEQKKADAMKAAALVKKS
jgi:hypothetical protein